MTNSLKMFIACITRSFLQLKNGRHFDTDNSIQTSGT